MVQMKIKKREFYLRKWFNKKKIKNQITLKIKKKIKSNQITLKIFIPQIIKQAPKGHGSDFLKDCPLNALC